MSCDRSKLYSDAMQFYSENGNNIMKLTPEAAIDVCKLSMQFGYIVSRIEGGIWHGPGFEMRLDCIWDRPDIFDGIPSNASKDAVDFIQEERSEHDVFIVSLQKIELN